MAATGRCLCGGVRYAVTGKLRPVMACHCTQCRRWSGNFVAATSARTADLTFADSATLAWYHSSETAERGFCVRCGSPMFWREVGGRHTSIMAGTLDPPTGLRLDRHIFVADKSDYYDLTDGLPQHEGWPD